MSLIATKKLNDEDTETNIVVHDYELGSISHSTATRPEGSRASILSRVANSLTSIHDLLMRTKKQPASKGGRIVPIRFTENRELLVDIRTGKPYCSNLITSSIYTRYNFLPRQIIAQFSKLANL